MMEAVDDPSSSAPTLLTRGDADTPPPSANVSINSSSSSSSEALEERYNKLKAITLKYKKKIAEQNQEIENLNKCQNASKIQQEYDKALDEVEKLKKSESTLQKDLQKSVDETVRLKIAESEANGQIQNLTSSHKTLREKLDKLEAESTSVEELKSTISSLEKELQEVKDVSVDAQQGKRQLQILSLEVTDYEKKLQELQGGFEAKKVECDKVSHELSDRDQKVKELESSIFHYKDSEKKLTLSRDSLQAEVNRRTEKIAFLQEEMGKLNERLNDRKAELDKVEKALDTERKEGTSQRTELLQKLDNSQRMLAASEQKVSLLEENRRDRETQINNLKLEIAQLDLDYSNYKRKAQTMLKSQMVPVKDSDEIDKLQKAVHDFHAEVSILKSELFTLKLENENLGTEKTDLTARLNQLRAKSLESEVQLGNEVQRLKQTLRENEERVVNMQEAKTQEIEQIRDEARIELVSTRTKYESQLSNLREEFEVLKSERQSSPSGFTLDTNISRVLEGQCSPAPQPQPQGFSLQRVNQETPVHSQRAVTEPIAVDTSNTSGLTYDQMRMIPRGEGEGSEGAVSASAYNPRVDNYNVSFEQLLSTSFDSVSKESDTFDHDAAAALKLNSLQTELVRYQNQVSHLTSVLRESESNCDRLAELSEVLKEEIRRIERDKERQEHLKENTEYLKNVLLKFVTLNGQAERQRLIPVLKTMLRLTPEEVEKLEGIAQGKETKDAGWSSYLHLWKGGGGNGSSPGIEPNLWPN